MCMSKLFDRYSTMFMRGCCINEMSYRPKTNCLRDEENYCKESSVKILKFIRMKMEPALQLLRMFSNIKVIHLVRDARGIMFSRHFGKYKNSKLNVI